MLHRLQSTVRSAAAQTRPEVKPRRSADSYGGILRALRANRTGHACAPASLSRTRHRTCTARGTHLGHASHRRQATAPPREVYPSLPNRRQSLIAEAAALNLGSICLRLAVEHRLQPVEIALAAKELRTHRWRGASSAMGTWLMRNRDDRGDRALGRSMGLGVERGDEESWWRFGGDLVEIWC